MTTLLRNTKATFSLSCPRHKQETEGFHWIRKESEIAQYVSRLEFTYKDGFVVTFWVPKEWPAEYLSEVIDRVCLQYSTKFSTDSRQ